MTIPTPRIIPPTGANLGAARLDRLDSEIHAHLDLAQKHYVCGLENRAAFIEAHAAGKSAQYLKDLALMDFALTNIEQSAATLCYQQIKTMLLGSVLACVAGEDDDSDEGFTLNREVKPA